MRGIDLNQPITYLYSSLRFFNEKEHHITRFCTENVLLMVFDGILRFSEDDVDYEVFPGEYFIQKNNAYQKGDIVSDSPKYLYVHFLGEWTECANAAMLPYRGEYDPAVFMSIMEAMDQIAHGNYTIIEQDAKFYEILSLLYRSKAVVTMGNQIAAFIAREYVNGLSLEMISQQFHFSKNHIINIFKREYQMTPFEYMNALKIKKAERLLEITSDTAESIARECGFRDYSYFYKVFCRKNKVSPVEWRNIKRMHPAMKLSSD